MANKKNDLSNVTIIPASASREAARFIPRQEIQELLQGVKEKDRNSLQEEIENFSAARLQHVQSGLAMGKHLANIYNTCESYSGSFRRIVGHLGLNERTAYRYMGAYKSARVSFHDNIIKAAIVQGIDSFTKYAPVIKMLSAPVDPDPQEAQRYIKQMVKTYKERNRALASGDIEPDEADVEEQVQKDPEKLHMDNFRGIKNALNHVPKRQRQKWFESLVGMAMTQMGYASATSFEPYAIPDAYRQGPGRPPSVHEAA